MSAAEKWGTIMALCIIVWPTITGFSWYVGDTKEDTSPIDDAAEDGYRFALDTTQEVINLRAQEEARKQELARIKNVPVRLDLPPNEWVTFAELAPTANPVEYDWVFNLAMDGEVEVRLTGTTGRSNIFSINGPKDRSASTKLHAACRQVGLPIKMEIRNVSMGETGTLTTDSRVVWLSEAIRKERRVCGSM